MRAAELEVLAAAECVTHSYRAYGGYTVPLSINLRRLDDAVRVWQAAIHAASLDSDTNGFDRSTVWGEEGNSNEQSGKEVTGDKSKPRRCSGQPTQKAGREAAQNEGGAVRKKAP